MQPLYSFLLPFLLFVATVAGCEKQPATPDPDPGPDPGKDTVDTYTNPVFEPVLADPTVVRDGDFFYAYGTEDNWGNEGGYQLVPIVRSDDLIDWELISNAFQLKPNWKQDGGIWAPDVTEVDGKFYMYYSYSLWGDPNPGIGLAIADKPRGPFLDQGKVFLSNEIGVANSIDPFYIEENGTKYLFWGSFQGLYVVALSEDGRRAVGNKTQVAGNHLEAIYIHQREGYYYLFGSAGSCCDGANSTYRILVGRSQNLLGPYVDKQGRRLLDGPYGELILRTHDEPWGYVGPGHNAEIVTDDEGTDWLLYHAMQKSNPRLSNGTNRRSLMLDKLIWTDGWPTIADQEPSISKQAGPVFE